MASQALKGIKRIYSNISIRISGLIGKLNRTGGTTGSIGLDKIITAATPENDCEGVLILIDDQIVQQSFRIGF